MLSIAGTGDSMTLRNHFSSDSAQRPVQEVRLFTGAVVSVDALLSVDHIGSGDADRIDGSETANVITGLAGADTLSGYGGNDTLDGGADNDRLNGGDGNDSLIGGLGNDTLGGDAGDDILDGGTGADWLEGGSGNNTYRFGRGDGADGIGSYDSTATRRNVLEFKAGVVQADLRAARVSSDLVLSIAGTSDSVTLRSYFLGSWSPVQEMRLSTGALISADALLQQTFGGTATWDQLDGTVLDDVMTGLAGADTLFGNAGNDSLDGGADNDWLYGGDGADRLLGGQGEDRLFGDAGDDTLDGGAGVDSLDGGYGNNIYRFGRGDGADVISSNDPTVTKRNVLEFKAGVAQADLRAARVGHDLVLNIAGTGDSVTLRNCFSFGGGAWDGRRGPVQEVRLSNGAQVSADALVQMLTFDGTAAVDYMDGTALADVMTGLGGNDFLWGHGGDDRLDGGADDDQLFGGDGDDILDGGAGADRLNGGSGNNTYRFGRGDGADEIISNDPTATKRNVLEFKAGVAQADLRAARVFSDLVLSIAGTTDSVRLSSYFSSDLVWRSVQDVRLSSGVLVSVDALLPLNYVGSEAADQIHGSEMGNVVTGLEGADLLFGYGGNDSLDGGAENDQLYGGDGNDSLVGGLGNDTVYGDAGDDVLVGGAGADFMFSGSGNDRLDGGDGNDQLGGNDGNDSLTGGVGDDYLYGGSGQDTYYFGTGDGRDYISDSGTDGAIDTVQFRSGVGLGNLTISRADSGRDLVVVLGTTDRIVLDDRLVNMNGGADRLRFADSRSLSVEALVQAMAAFGTPAAGELSLARADVQQYLTPLLASGA